MNDKSKENKLQKYEDYFKEDYDNLNNALEETKTYLKTTHDKISELSKATGRGIDTYMNKYIENAASLLSQKQGLLKDKVALKKLIMDYSLKSEKEEDTNESLVKMFYNVIKQEQAQSKGNNDAAAIENSTAENTKDADDDIKKRLGVES